jgi:hypothetical protein
MSSLNTKISYVLADLAPAADTVVTTQECDFISARVTTVLSAHAVAIEATTGGDVIGHLAASAAVGTTVAGDGIRVPGITLAGDAASTGVVLVAFRVTSL